MAKTPFTRRNALVGYATTKLLFPYIRRAMKRRARSAATGAAKSSVVAAKNNPKRTGVAVGAAAGAIAWFLRQRALDDAAERPVRRERHDGPY
jgi:hypothetical protein